MRNYNTSFSPCHTVVVIITRAFGHFQQSIKRYPPVFLSLKVSFALLFYYNVIHPVTRAEKLESFQGYHTIMV